MAVISLGLKGTLTLENWFKLIIIGAVIRIVYSFLPMGEIVAVIIAIIAGVKEIIPFFSYKQYHPIGGSNSSNTLKSNNTGITHYMMERDPNSNLEGGNNPPKRGHKRYLSSGEMPVEKKSNISEVIEGGTPTEVEVPVKKESLTGGQFNWSRIR